MTFGLAMSVAIAFAIGFAVVSRLWPQVERTSPALLPFRIFLALGVGQGLTACLAFVYLVVRGRLDRPYVLVEVLVVLALTGAGGFFGCIAAVLMVTFASVLSVRRQITASRPLPAPGPGTAECSAPDTRTSGGNLHTPDPSYPPRR